MTDEDALLCTFGDRLPVTRREAGPSQDSWADQVSLHRIYIGSVERGERNTALLNILTLATVLDTEAGTLLTGLQHQPQ